tara:strand:- start:8917 stop:9852 length:936 start_codon:yes stop_codon:yes gene_type:complete
LTRSFRKTAKSKLHPRNQHTDGYDFKRLIKHSPELADFIASNPAGHTSIDFSDAHAVRALNRALLHTHYNIKFWDIPENYLCPPIPGRVDYLHYLADLLALDNNNQVPHGRAIKVLDIGTGANLVYPLTGQSEYGWSFTGSDIDPVAVTLAQQIVKFNQLKIAIKLQKNSSDIFRGIITAKDSFHLTLCNPPFHTSNEEAQQGTQRKWKNLGKGSSSTLNFGGQNSELWCPGGEVKFITTMIAQSTMFADQCLWFSSLVSKKESLKPLYAVLKKSGVEELRTIDMAQGQKVSRFIAWTFIDQAGRRAALKN